MFGIGQAELLILFVIGGILLSVAAAVGFAVWMIVRFLTRQR
jgi:hypothetical protein